MSQPPSRCILHIGSDITTPENYKLQLCKNHLYGQMIAVMGQYNVGKSFLLNKLTDQPNLFESGSYLHTEGVHFVQVESARGQTVFVDSQGKGQPIQLFDRDDMTLESNSLEIRREVFARLENRRCLDKMFENFLFSVCNVFVYVVNMVSRSTQQDIRSFVERISKIPGADGKMKRSKVIVLHNFKDVTNMKDLSTMWTRVKEYFNLTTKEITTVDNQRLVEVMCDKDEFHLYMGGEIADIDTTKNPAHPNLFVQSYNKDVLDVLQFLALSQVDVNDSALRLKELTTKAMEGILRQCMYLSKFDSSKAEINLEATRITYDDEIEKDMECYILRPVGNNIHRYQKYPDFLNRMQHSSPIGKVVGTTATANVYRTISTQRTLLQNAGNNVPDVSNEGEVEEEEHNFGDDSDDEEDDRNFKTRPIGATINRTEGVQITTVESNFVIEILAPLINASTLKLTREKRRFLIEFQLQSTELCKSKSILDVNPDGVIKKNRIEKQVQFDNSIICKEVTIPDDFEIDQNIYACKVYDDGLIRIVFPRITCE